MNPENNVTNKTPVKCSRCDKIIFFSELTLIGNQIVYANSEATKECTTPCSPTFQHKAPIPKYLILPQTRTDSSTFLIRLEDTKG